MFSKKWHCKVGIFLMIMLLPAISWAQCKPAAGKFQTTDLIFYKDIIKKQFYPYEIKRTPAKYIEVFKVNSSTPIHTFNTPSGYSASYSVYGPKNQYLTLLHTPQTSGTYIILYLINLESTVSPIPKYQLLKVSKSTNPKIHVQPSTDGKAVFVYLSYQYNNSANSFFIYCSDNGQILCSYGATLYNLVGKKIYAEATSTDVQIIVDGKKEHYCTFPIPKINVSPTDLKFGNVLINTPATTNFTIENTGTATLTYSISSSNKLFVPLPATGSISTSKKTASITVTFKAPAGTTLGPQKGTLTITNNATATPVPITVEATVTGPYMKLTPTSVIFKAVAYPNSDKQEVKIENIGTANLEIKDIKFTNTSSLFNITSSKIATIYPKNYENVKIEFSPKQYTQGGTYTNILEIYHNISSQPFKVPLTATVNAGAIKLTPANLDFKSVYTNTQNKLLLVVENTGTADLKITDVKITNYPSSFTIDATSPKQFTLVPGGKQNIYILFTSPNVGQYKDILKITHSASAIPESVSLTATVITPSPDISIKWWETKMGGTVPKWTSEDIWIDNTTPDPTKSDQKKFLTKNDPLKLNNKNRIYAHFKNQGVATAYDVGIEFHAADSVGAMHFDPDKDGNPINKVGNFKLIKAVPIVITTSKVQDNNKDGKIDSLPAGVEATVYIEWTPTTGNKHRCIATQLIAVKDETVINNNITQENITIVSTPPPIPPSPAASFQVPYPFKVFNPFPGKPTVVELELQKELPDDWNVTLSPKVIDFDASDLYSNAEVVVTAPLEKVKGGYRGLISVSPHGDREEILYGGFSLLIEIIGGKQKLQIVVGILLFISLLLLVIFILRKKFK